MVSPSYYEILGVTPQASPEEIKRAFRSFSRAHHPDMGGDEETFKQGNMAYETLSDPDKRHVYDRDVLAKDQQHKAQETPRQHTSKSSSGGSTTFTPPPSAPVTAAPFTGETHVVTGMPRLGPLVSGMSVIGFIQAACVSAGSSNRLFFGCVVGIVAGLWAEHRYDVPPWRSSATAAIITVFVVACLSSIGAWLFLPSLFRPVSTCLTFFLITAIALPTQRAVRRESKLLSMDDLRTCNLFGKAAGGIIHARTEEIIATTLAARPDVRIMRRPAPNGFFTYALIAGSYVVMVRGVDTGAGDYWWHGSSLIRRDRMGRTHEVISGDYEGVLTSLRSHAPGLTMTSVMIALEADTVRDDSDSELLPHVVAASGLAAYIDLLPTGVVDRHACAQLLEAWYEADVPVV